MVQLNVNTIKSSLLATLLALRTVSTLQCFKCESDPNCRSSKECMESCNNSQGIATCKEYKEIDHACINISYSYLKHNRTVYVYKRECWMDLIDIESWGCVSNCDIPRHLLNSTDCQATCCRGDFCNSNSPKVSKLQKIISDSHGQNIATPSNLLLTSLLVLVIFLHAIER